MPSHVPAVRYNEARHSSMRTLLSSAGVSWRTRMGYTSYARNRACALPSPSPFHYAMAKIVEQNYHILLADKEKGFTSFDLQGRQSNKINDLQLESSLLFSDNEKSKLLINKFAFSLNQFPTSQ